MTVVQTLFADNVAEALEKKLGTEVQVGRIDLRLPNRLIVDDLLVYDQQQKKMLRVARVSVSVDILSLLDGEISINSAQLFGMNANLYKATKDAPINCQFVIDSLASKDTTSHTPLNLNIASLIIRNGAFSYNEHYEPMSRGKFSPHHINVKNLSSHIILYKLTDDYINVALNRMSLEEQSGIKINNFTTDFKYSKGNVHLKDFILALPESDIRIPQAKISYKTTSNDSILPGSMKFNGNIYAKNIDPMDFTAFADGNKLASLPSFTIKASAEGTDKRSEASLMLKSAYSDNLILQSSYVIKNLLENPSAEILLSRLDISEQMMRSLASTFKLPTELTNLGSIAMKGKVMYANTENASGDIDIVTSRGGKASLTAAYNGSTAKVNLKAQNINLAQILNDQSLGVLECSIDADARTTDGRMLTKVKDLSNLQGKLKGIVNKVTAKDYTYHDIMLDASVANSIVKGSVSIDDPNIRLLSNGSVGLGRLKSLNINTTLKDFSPKALHLTNDFGRGIIAMQMNADMNGTDINNMMGNISIHNVSIIDVMKPEENTYLNNLDLNINKDEYGNKEITLNSDIADASMRGDITLTEIPQSLTNLVAKHLPSLPGLPKVKPTQNSFFLKANIKDLTFVKKFVNLPLDIYKPININGHINSQDDDADLALFAPAIAIDGTELRNTQLRLWTPDNAIHTVASTLMLENNDEENKEMRDAISLSLDAKGEKNTLFTSLSWDNLRQNVFRGQLHTTSLFYKSLGGKDAVQVSIPNSSFEVGDTIWRIHSQGISYEDEKLTVNHLVIGNSNQHVYVDGVASKSPNDSIVADLHNVDVEYIMNLINFHSVDFAGYAYGKAVSKGVMGPLSAYAQLDVKDFLFEHGHMGDMNINAKYSNETEQIDIDAMAVDNKQNGSIKILGNISPQRNTIDLDIKAKHTRMEFMESLCGSFMKDVNMHGTGRVRLAGLLSAINLTGGLKAEGDFTITSTNCRYNMPKDSITFIPDDILFKDCPLKDKYGNVAYLNGGVHHRNLGRISFDLTAKTNRFLAYDRPNLDGDTFCGHAIISGNIGLHGLGNEVDITADCTALDDSYIVYDATSPDAIKSQDFITWGSASQKKAYYDASNADNEDDVNNSGNDRTNIRMRFMVNATPKAKLHLLMDATTGDYVDLYGSGDLRVNYYNKGTMDIFGNYNIDHGIYKMTIQNLIRREFEFQRGGLIAFGGDPYNAVLKLQAAYNLNSVSLADLSIGTSFKANNVPVKCLMDITGTPAKPQVDFNLDLPSLSSDARQMVYSVINSEEEMNQQVLYLLAIGRFYSQQNSTENSERAGQTTLAMQSFLSGTLSQQLNNVLKQAIGNDKWSFGANIAPGNDGFNNAEYEGLLSGRLLNNRLLFNGQFGYRDNITKNTQNFIGDFSLQYLLTPNGNVAVKVYNQSNDRYFTRNSLNTQGVGIVIQKEFGKTKKNSK